MAKPSVFAGLSDTSLKPGSPVPKVRPNLLTAPDLDPEVDTIRREQASFAKKAPLISPQNSDEDEDLDEEEWEDEEDEDDDGEGFDDEWEDDEEDDLELKKKAPSARPSASPQNPTHESHAGGSRANRASQAYDPHMNVGTAEDMSRMTNGTPVDYSRMPAAPAANGHAFGSAHGMTNGHTNGASSYSSVNGTSSSATSAPKRPRKPNANPPEMMSPHDVLDMVNWQRERLNVTAKSTDKSKHARFLPVVVLTERPHVDDFILRCGAGNFYVQAIPQIVGEYKLNPRRVMVISNSQLDEVQRRRAVSGIHPLPNPSQSGNPDPTYAINQQLLAMIDKQNQAIQELQQQALRTQLEAQARAAAQAQIPMSMPSISPGADTGTQMANVMGNMVALMQQQSMQSQAQTMQMMQTMMEQQAQSTRLMLDAIKPTHNPHAMANPIPQPPVPATPLSESMKFVEAIMTTAKGMASIANPTSAGAAPAEDANWLKALNTLAENGDKIGMAVDYVGSAVSNVIDVVRNKKAGLPARSNPADDDLNADIAKKRYDWEDDNDTEGDDGDESE